MIINKKCFIKDLVARSMEAIEKEEDIKIVFTDNQCEDFCSNNLSGEDYDYVFCQVSQYVNVFEFLKVVQFNGSSDFDKIEYSPSSELLNDVNELVGLPCDHKDVFLSLKIAVDLKFEFEL
jgi:hypothetical protein